MKDNNTLKDLFKVFGEKKKNEEQMDSIANIFYDLGNKEEKENDIEKLQHGK